MTEIPENHPALEMLSAWATAQPSRCKHQPEKLNRYLVLRDGLWLTALVVDGKGRYLLNQNIQAAAQEAIEERWDIWLVQVATWEKGYFAEIPAIDGGFRRRDEPIYPSPAEALLAGLLKGIEAEKVRARHDEPRS